MPDTDTEEDVIPFKVGDLVVFKHIKAQHGYSTTDFLKIKKITPINEGYEENYILYGDVFLAWRKRYKDGQGDYYGSDEWDYAKRNCKYYHRPTIKQIKRWETEIMPRILLERI